MKQCIALAAVVCLWATGCAQTGLFAKKDCGDACSDCVPCHVARSSSAPRPEILRTACRPGCEGCASCASRASSAGARLAEVRSRANVGCEFGEECYPCSCDMCCGDGVSCDTCRTRLVDKVAGGFCRCRDGCRDGCQRCVGGCCGINPHAGGYPEMTTFNPSQPTGQVAYPYYTVRGPRDFLQDNPPSIGPY